MTDTVRGDYVRQLGVGFQVAPVSFILVIGLAQLSRLGWPILTSFLEKESLLVPLFRPATSPGGLDRESERAEEA
jgi:hypothetical protein